MVNAETGIAREIERINTTTSSRVCSDRSYEMRVRSSRLRVARLTFRRKRLREPLAIFWDGRRPLPRYGTAFCRALADHVRAVFPVTGPSG